MHTAGNKKQKTFALNLKIWSTPKGSSETVVSFKDFFYFIYLGRCLMFNRCALQIFKQQLRQHNNSKTFLICLMKFHSSTVSGTKKSSKMQQGLSCTHNTVSYASWGALGRKQALYYAHKVRVLESGVSRKEKKIGDIRSFPEISFCTISLPILSKVKDPSSSITVDSITNIVDSQIHHKYIPNTSQRDAASHALCIFSLF